MAAAPGFVAQPFRWSMVLPWLADVLTGLVYYFAGMLTAQRQARWYGSRCLGLGAGLFCSILVWTLPEFQHAMMAIVLVGGVVALAAWGSFCAGGAYAPQPRLARIALAVTLLTGLLTVSFVAKIFLGRWWEPGTRYAALIDRQGRVLDIHTKDGELQSVSGLEGPLIDKLNDGRLDHHALLENATPEARVDLTRRQSYRSANRSLVEHKNPTRPGNEIWYYVPDQGWLLGYEKQAKRLIGSFGPDGFAAPGERPREQFAGPLYHDSNFPAAFALGYLAFPGAVYKVDFHERKLRTLFVPPAGESVLWASPWEDEKQNLSLAFVGTDQSVCAVDEAGSKVFSAPLAFDATRHRVRSAGRLENPTRYWVWFEPQWFLGVESLESTCAYLVEYDTTGREMVRRSMPARPENARGNDPRALIFEPSYSIAVSGLVTSPAEFAFLAGTRKYLLSETRRDNGTEMSLLVPVLFFTTQFYLPNIGYLPRTPAGLIYGFAALMLLSVLVSALMCLQLARRYAFSRLGCIGWALCGLLWGPAGLLLMPALYDWPARIACPKCRKLRVITRETCEHCGALHAQPAPDGTEIFEPMSAIADTVMAES
jgi:hypothetical protein